MELRNISSKNQERTSELLFRWLHKDGGYCVSPETDRSYFFIVPDSYHYKRAQIFA